jgi:two-component system sensor histidine kinase KdpD
VEQVLLNLLENALKYTPEGTPLSIAARVQEEQLLVEVADQGPGLPGQDLENIFEMYYRGAAKNSQNGYGLGLAICKAIVRAHGGRIWALNRPGGGAAFCFTLPLDPGQRP